MNTQNSGSALIIAITFLLIVSAVAAGALALTDRRWSEERQWERQVVARHLAEAGIDSAIARFHSAGRFDIGDAATALGEGRFRVTAQPLPASHYRLVAIGECQPDDIVTARATIEAEIAVSAKTVSIVRWEEKR